jgi:uncharacterized integral membrane protein (TIGR00697 family)
MWGKTGLYAVIACSGIVCNIQVMVTVELFGVVATLGNIVYASIFFATDIISEHYGSREARRGVWIGFFSLIWATIAMQLAIRFVPDESDFMLGHLTEVFSLMPRVVVASLAAYLVSQHHDIWAFAFWKQKTSGRYLWFRNNASTFISQLADSVVFTLIAFLGVFDTDVLVQIVATTYILKLIVAVIDTPFLYISRSIARHRPT